MANNKLAYGLAKANGINTDGMTPKEVWDALAENGISTSYPQNTKYEDMLKDDEEEREIKVINEKVLTNDKKDDIMHSYPRTKGFRNKKDLYNHYKHSSEFGLFSMKEYETKAVAFMNNRKGEVYYSKSKHRYYKYNKETVEFGVIGEDSNLITYFKPKNGDAEKAIKYFNNQIKLNGGIKIEK